MATVVVMDDDDFVRSFVARLLQVSGHEVLTFPDAEPALKEVDFDQVDLVITDLQMPTSGEVAIQEIRKRGHSVPIVVMSGYIEPRDANYYVELGAQSVLLKPFTIESFWKINSAWIAKTGNQLAG